MRVDLPAPLSPPSATAVPWGMCGVTPRSTHAWPPEDRNQTFRKVAPHDSGGRERGAAATGSDGPGSRRLAQAPLREREVLSLMAEAAPTPRSPPARVSRRRP
jgi:hypothetical protein